LKFKSPLYYDPSSTTILGICTCKKNKDHYRSYCYVNFWNGEPCQTYSKGIKPIGVLPGTNIPAGINEEGKLVRVDPIINEHSLYNLDYARGLAKKIKAYVKMLDFEDYPRDGICSHFGLDFRYDHDRVGISLCSAKEKNRGKLQVTIYLPETKDYVGRSEEFYKHLLNMLNIQLWSDVIDFWNGLDGQKGISVVFNRDVPLSINCGTANYHKLPDRFNCTEKEEEGFTKFREWVKEKKKVVNL
jgi:hypothetical protein